MTEYVNLHCHDHYSIMDALAKTEDYAKAIKKIGGKYLAITNHGTLSGVWEQYRVCKKYNLKPIYGCELYVVENNRDKKRGYNHITLLVKNETGWKNLLKIVSDSYVNGFYYKPRTDWDKLFLYSEGLIALSGCLSGIISRCILSNEFDMAGKWIKWLKGVYGEDFYLEIMPNTMKEQKEVNSKLVSINADYGIPMVATVDSHYISPEDAIPHDLVLAIGRGEYFYDESRHHYSSNDFWFHTGADIMKAFLKHHKYLSKTEIKKAIGNSIRVSNNCDFNFDVDKKHLPKFVVKESWNYDKVLDVFENKDIKNKIDYLSASCLLGFSKIFNVNLCAVDRDEYKMYRDRLVKELRVIYETGYVDYMLIVADIVNWAKKNGIEVGTARGSVAGSIVAYFLGITNIDSIKHGLSFERFMNAPRMKVEMPDIDVDIQANKRQCVLNYIIDKYGKENTCSIIGHSYLAAKGALKSVATSLKIPFVKANNISKYFEYGESFEQALERNADIKKVFVADDADDEKWFDFSRAVEGLIRYSTKHAAGLVITPGCASKFIPLCKDKSGDLMSQWDKKDLEFAGMLKIDLLGLRTLDIISEVKSRLSNRGISLDLDNMDLKDKDVLREFNRGNTDSVFQFETDNMKNLLIGTPVKKFEMLPMLNSLGRPGTLSMGMHIKFMDRANGKEAVTYLHDKLKEVLEETYGIIVYQEQVQQIAICIGQLSPEDSDRLRVAMKLKKPKVMKGFKRDFIKGAISIGVDKRKAIDIWKLINAFATYTFNKSHAVAYSYIAWQCMYLKINYSLDWFVALLNSEIGNQEKISQYKTHMENVYGIKLFKPDINKSDVGFEVGKVGDDTGIVYGLSAIKDIGVKTANKIIKMKPYKSVEDFINKAQKINKKVLEALIRSGATDFLGDRLEIVKGLFGTGKLDENSTLYPLLRSSGDNYGYLVDEDYYFGFYFSNVFKQYEKSINDNRLLDVEVWKKKAKYYNSIKGYALISRRYEHKTKNGDIMCFITLSNGDIDVEALCWPSEYLRYRKLVKENTVRGFSIVKLHKRNKNEDQKFVIKSVFKI
ncbi:MAG: DNA polymerase III subunit alpha [Candidatus Lokiarchaeota archaeon]|nr:DNA polymerase III subunit alpha [Candidatus Lokiarchaeota archaeon]